MQLCKMMLIYVMLRTPTLIIPYFIRFCNAKKVSRINFYTAVIFFLFYNILPVYLFAILYIANTSPLPNGLKVPTMRPP